MREEIEAAYAMFDVDERVKCIVVTGTGRIFCAGADLDAGFGQGTFGEDAERVQDHRDGYVSCEAVWLAVLTMLR
jgi:enoyl-CoA hydratase/carnithine racemase